MVITEHRQICEPQKRYIYCSNCENVNYSVGGGRYLVFCNYLVLGCSDGCHSRYAKHLPNTKSLCFGCSLFKCLIDIGNRIAKWAHSKWQLMSNIWWAIRQSSFSQIWGLIRSGSSTRTFNHFVRWRFDNSQWSSGVISLSLSGGERVSCFSFHFLRMYVVNCTCRHCQLTNGEVSPQVENKTRKSRSFGLANQVDKQNRINIFNHCNSPFLLGSLFRGWKYMSTFPAHCLNATDLVFLLNFTRFHKQTTFRVNLFMKSSQHNRDQVQNKSSALLRPLICPQWKQTQSYEIGNGKNNTVLFYNKI